MTSDEQITASVDQARAAAREDRAAPERAGRTWFRRALGAAVVVSLLISGASAAGVAYLYARSAAQDQLAADQQRRADAQDASLLAVRQLAERAAPEGEKANDKLRQRGQAPVEIPAPGEGDARDTIVASAAAQVLARIPDPSPSAAELGRAVARYLAGRSLVSPQQLAEALAGYLATHPLPAGPQGPTGVPGQPGANGRDGAAGRDGADGAPGRPPNEQEIEQALADYLQQHPEALCPRGGAFTMSRVLLADGGSQDQWACVVQQYPPTSPPPSDDPGTPLLPE